MMLGWISLVQQTVCSYATYVCLLDTQCVVGELLCHHRLLAEAAVMHPFADAHPLMTLMMCSTRGPFQHQIWHRSSPRP